VVNKEKCLDKFVEGRLKRSSDKDWTRKELNLLSKLIQEGKSNILDQTFDYRSPADI
jgi:hypothetical protein